MVISQDAPAASPNPGPGLRPLHRAVFVDRDGTLNPDLKYLSDADRLEVYRGVADGIRLLRSHGYIVICVTNQSGIERGLYTAADVERIHRRLNEVLATKDTRLDGFYYCPHVPESNCDCRKPGTRLFERAREENAIAFPQSAIVGDRSLDIEAGEKLGLLTVLVPSPGHTGEAEAEMTSSRVSADLRAPSFYAAAARILARG